MNIPCHYCKAPIPHDSLRCRHCTGDLSLYVAKNKAIVEKKEKTSMTSLLAFAGIFGVICLGAAFTPSSSTSAEAPKLESQQSKVVGIGDIGVLDTHAGNVWVAANESAFDEFNKYAAANDNTGMAEMVLNGRLFIVPCGSTARVLESDLFKKQVRIVQQKGRHQSFSGRAGYIASEWIQPLPPKSLSTKPRQNGQHTL